MLDALQEMADVVRHSDAQGSPGGYGIAALEGNERPEGRDGRRRGRLARPG